MKTSLDTHEKEILSDFDKLVDKWSKKLKLDNEDIRSSISYLWEDRERKGKKAFREWLSANDMGPFGGR